MDELEKVDFSTVNANIISLSFTEYSAKFLLDEINAEIPDDGIDVEIAPEIRLQWAFNREVQQVMVKAALRLLTPIVEITTEIRAEYDTAHLNVGEDDAGFRLLHEFVIFAADRDLHPAHRLAVQELSMKVMNSPIILPIGYPFRDSVARPGNMETA